jgi:hypothetical protein
MTRAAAETRLYGGGLRSVFRRRLGVDSGVRCDRDGYREWITAVRAPAGHGAARAGAQEGEES